MGLLASLYVNLGLKDAEYSRKLDKNKANTQAWSKDIGKYTAIAAGSFVAVGTAGALAGKKIWDAQAPVIDRLGKFSDSVDISIGKLQSYRHAGELAGVSTNQLDSSLARFNRRLGKAAEGGGAAAKAIQTLGLDAKKLSEAGTETAFEVMLDKLHDVEDVAIRNGLAFDIFGDSATEVMRLTSEQLSTANRELEEFGILLNRVDAAKVESANDAMYKVGVYTDGVSKKLAVDMAPLLQASAELFLETARSSNNFGNIGSRAVDFVATAVGWLGDQVQNVQKGFYLVGYATTIAISKVVKGLNIIGVTSAETVKEWEGYVWSAFDDLSDLAARENFSDRLSRKMEYARQKAEELGQAVKKIDKGAALGLDADFSLDKKSVTKKTGKSAAEAKNDPFFDAQIIAFQQYKQQLSSGFVEIEDSFKLHFDNRYKILAEALERDVITQAQYDAQMQNIRVENEEKAARAIGSVRSNLTDNLIGLLNRLGQKHSIFAKLAVALEAKRALAENNQKTAVAAMQAYSSQFIPGIPATLASAQLAYAKTMTLGKINAGLILANAALDASGGLGGGGGAGGTSIGSASYTDQSTATQTVQPASIDQAAGSPAGGNIYILGGNTSVLDMDRYREMLKELVEHDAVKLTSSQVDDMRIEVI